MDESIRRSTSGRQSNAHVPPEPNSCTEPQAVQHNSPAQGLDTTSVKSCDIESQSTTGSNLSSSTFDEESGAFPYAPHLSSALNVCSPGIRLAVQRIRKALHIRESPYSHRLRSKIRPRRSKPYVPVKERRSSHLVDSYQRGYSTLAAIQDSDPNFLIYRKFGWLRNRLLLDLQDQLVTLEEELQLLDDNDARLRDPDKVLISRRNDELQKTLRQDLLRTIRQKLLEYGMRQVILIAALELIVIADEVLLHLQQVQHMRRPTFRNQNSLFNMIWSNKCQVHEEMEWILRREDLAALARDSEHGWFNGFVEDTLNAISRTMTAVGPSLANSENLSKILACHQPCLLGDMYVRPGLTPHSSSSVILIEERRQEKSTSAFFPRNVLRSSCGPYLSL